MFPRACKRAVASSLAPALAQGNASDKTHGELMAKTAICHGGAMALRAFFLGLLGLLGISGCGANPGPVAFTLQSGDPIPASAITHTPADMTGVNSQHPALRDETSAIRFGTQADWAMVTLGPKDGGIPDYTPYSQKISLNIKMPFSPVLAPLDLRFVGFKNRSAVARISGLSRQEPFDDLELCFESQALEWPGMVMCVYHLYTTPLLQTHLMNGACGIAEEWDGGGAEQGQIFFWNNDSFENRDDPESCGPLLGTIIPRGGVIGYSGQVEDNPHAAFDFKVRATEPNPLTRRGDRLRHWVQPSVFFYWACHEDGKKFPAGVLAYPFQCEGFELPSGEGVVTFKD